MSLKHTILGFLSFRSLSGYDLKKAFDQSVSHFWPADQSQIYRTLKQLDKEGLITKQVIPRQDQLDIKVYEITETGRQALNQWLSTPLPPTGPREPFFFLLYFAFMLQDDQVGYLLQTEIDQLDGMLREYETIYQTVSSRDIAEEEKRPFFYTMLTLEFGIRGNLWYRNWLQSVKDRIEAGDMNIFSLAEGFNPNNKQGET
ncbi:MAG: PadR family transcriptional regulator [Anaerolineales bacterium]|nr:PadR family transcriptional regulator [Anaerolineales bacterium]